MNKNFTTTIVVPKDYKTSIWDVMDGAIRKLLGSDQAEALHEQFTNLHNRVVEASGFFLSGLQPRIGTDFQIYADECLEIVGMWAQKDLANLDVENFGKVQEFARDLGLDTLDPSLAHVIYLVGVRELSGAPGMRGKAWTSPVSAGIAIIAGAGGDQVYDGSIPLHELGHIMLGDFAPYGKSGHPPAGLWWPKENGSYYEVMTESLMGPNYGEKRYWFPQEWDQAAGLISPP